MAKLFVDISAHGLGHLAQVAPVLNALARHCPQLELSIRSALPLSRLEARIVLPFRHFEDASDIGFCMLDALRIDHAASSAAYREFHADWAARVAREASLLQRFAPDFVLADVAYLPLAGAARAGIAAAAVSSLNWADLFAHYYGRGVWAGQIVGEMRAAYAAAPFLRLEPAMPMDWLGSVSDFGPVATRGMARRRELRERLKLPLLSKIVVVALGGVPGRLPVERWGRRDDVFWLVPRAWKIEHPQCRPLEVLGWPFPDVLASVDAIVAKPGYGTFAEAACNATPTAYIRRDDWPEQETLIAWLERVGRARELTPDQLAANDACSCLEKLWAQPARAAVAATGADDVAAWLATRLKS